VLEARGKRKQCEEAINETTARARGMPDTFYGKHCPKPKTENPEKPEACGI